MQGILLGFLGFVALYQPVSTLLIHGLGLVSGSQLALLRDSIWALILVRSMVQYRQYLISYLRVMRGWWGWWLLIVCWGVGLSVYNAYFGVNATMTRYTMDRVGSLILLGFKYGLLYRGMLLSATWLGYVYTQVWNTSDWSRRWRMYGRLIVGIIVCGIVWQGFKMLFPEVFVWRGYGALADFSATSRPPLYYLTAYEGSPRLSGLFAGPNEYGYVLMTLFSFFVYWVTIYLHQYGSKWMTIGTYIISLLATISRGALIGVGVQLIRHYGRRYWKWVVLGSIVGLGGVIGMSIWKPASTHTHLMSKVWNATAIMRQPMGYGLGISGPSIHYNGCTVCLNEQQCKLQPGGKCPYCDCFLPENVYMQLMLELGVVGFLLWFTMTCCWLWYMYRLLYRIRGIQDEQQVVIGRLLYAGFLGLLAEGMFLHVFESAVINYLFFVPLGIVWGWILQRMSED